MAIAGLEIDPSNRPTFFTVDPSSRAIPHPVYKTDSLTQVAGEMAAKELKPDYAMDLNTAMSNISQSEYSFKHRLLFETARRNQIKRLKERGGRASEVPRKRLRVLTSLDEKLLPSKIGQTREFIYDMDLHEVQHAKDSITQVEDAELRFLLIPTRCSIPRKVTFSLMEEETTLEVDACRVRWESLTVAALPPGSRARLSVTCKDCASKGVIYSSPYLNIITTTVPMKRLRRQVVKQRKKKQDKNRPPCSRRPLKMVFKNMPGYQSITSPTYADIGYCAGQCKAPLNAHNAHAVLHYAMFKKGLISKKPCCAPYSYEDFEYLTKNGTKLAVAIWKNAIAVNCSCQ